MDIARNFVSGLEVLKSNDGDKVFRAIEQTSRGIIGIANALEHCSSVGGNIMKIVNLAASLADPVSLVINVSKNLVFGGISAIGEINGAISNLSHGRLEAGG
jgi:hypothetical protein